MITRCHWYYPALSTYILNTHCCCLSASYGSAICDCDRSDGRCISLSSVESKMKKLSALLKKTNGEVHGEMVCGGSKYFPTCILLHLYVHVVTISHPSCASTLSIETKAFPAVLESLSLCSHAYRARQVVVWYNMCFMQCIVYLILCIFCIITASPFTRTFPKMRLCSLSLTKHSSFGNSTECNGHERSLRAT